MLKDNLEKRIKKSKLVAVLRYESPEPLTEVIRATVAGGINVIEVTMTVPNAADLIRQTADEFSDDEVLLGAGTVMSPEAAKAAVDAGAKFCVAPHFDQATVTYCNEQNIFVCPGAFTATEAHHAASSGADAIKIFPANIGGPQYVKDLLGPLPDLKIMVTGGVDVVTAPQFLRSGAIAVGVGGALFNRKMIETKDWGGITANARSLVACVADCEGR